MDYFGFVFTIALSLICFIISYFQFHERGILLNNAYIYLPMKDRENLYKKPYYFQSGTVFLLLGIMFLITSLEIIFLTTWLMYFVFIDFILVICYAIVSTVHIKKSGY